MHDSEGMHKIYDSWPKIANDSYHSEYEPVDFGPISHIVFTGMGGSGAIGDIFKAILSKAPLHITLVKGYTIPKTVNSTTLVVATSVSGNTDETNTTLRSARQLTKNIIAFSSGGKMREYCKENGLEYRTVPLFHSPRASFPGFLYSMLKVLEPLIPIKEEQIDESIKKLQILSEKIGSSNLTRENPSLDLAQLITGIPVIYYPYGLEAAAIRFKNSLQENVKTQAIAEDVIEACHNGIVPWEKPSIVQPILIQGDEDNLKTKERWIILKQFFNAYNINYKEVHSLKGGILTKLINLIYLLDYSSIYRAVLAGTDPSPVKSIDYVKKKLSTNLAELVTQS